MIVFLVLAFASGGGYWAGRQTERAASAQALVAAQAQSTALRESLTVAAAQVRHDTVPVTQWLTRWKAAKPDTVRDSIRVPVEVIKLVAIADSAIEAVDQNRRQCLVTLSTCERAVASATERADLATAQLARVNDALARSTRFRSIERGVCAASLAGNVFQWRFSPHD